MPGGPCIPGMPGHGLGGPCMPGGPARRGRRLDPLRAGVAGRRSGRWARRRGRPGTAPPTRPVSLFAGRPGAAVAGRVLGAVPGRVVDALAGWMLVVPGGVLTALPGRVVAVPGPVRGAVLGRCWSPTRLGAGRRCRRSCRHRGRCRPTLTRPRPRPTGAESSVRSIHRRPGASSAGPAGRRRGRPSRRPRRPEGPRPGTSASSAYSSSGTAPRSANNDGGRTTAAVTPQPGVGVRATSMPWRWARRATTCSPSRWDTDRSTSRGAFRRSLASVRSSARMPTPQSSTVSTKAPGVWR